MSTSAAAQSAPTASHLQIALLGNPNTGKTTLFNRLCGLRAKTANFPGTTSTARHGTWAKSGSADVSDLRLIDLPGTYRLSLDLPESEVCRRALAGTEGHPPPDAAVVVIDATQMPRSLCLVGEVLTYGLPTAVVLNMVDLAQKRGLTVDVSELSRRLGCPVVPMVARQGTGVDELRNAVYRALESGPPTPLDPPPADSTGDLEAWVDQTLGAALRGQGTAFDTATERLDLAFTHPILGVLTFLAVMGGLFWTVFAFAETPMGLIEQIFEVFGSLIVSSMAEGAVRDLLVDGVVAGVAGTVVFLPQICLLFFLISLLEDTGYLARAAFVMDRLLCRFGLPGHAFVPLLSSHACALPGIMSTRLIPDRKDRLATILVAPFMSCTARMPVYVLLTGLLFRDSPALAGLAFAACYLIGALAALGSAWLLRSVWLKGRSRPMILELPSYKMPSLRTAVLAAWHQGLLFLKNAGTVIVSICMVMWWLSAYPKVDPPPETQELRAQAEQVSLAEQRLELTAEADRIEARHAQAQSFAGRLGRGVEPVFAPLGFDWQLTVGVLTSFLAREVFVSTMAVLILGEPNDEVDTGVIDRVKRAERDDGSPLFTPATSTSLLLFFVLAMQCLPTLAVTAREAGGRRWAFIQWAYMSGLAWIVSFAVYQAMRLGGIG